MTPSTSPISSGSSADVGSSNSITSGSIASARAIATRCCCPPDRRIGYSSALSDRPTRSRNSIATRRAEASWMPLTVAGPSITF